MCTLWLLLLSLGQFLRSHWAGFSHLGKAKQTPPHLGTSLHSGRLTCSAYTGFRAITTPLKLIYCLQTPGK